MSTIDHRRGQGWRGPKKHERYYDALADELEVRRIRQWLVSLAERWWPAALESERDALGTVAAELLANVVRHAPGRVRALLLDSGQGNCLLAVADQNPAGPVTREAEPGEAESGLGLVLVRELTSGWGWHPVPFGKVVWAHLPMSRHTREASARAESRCSKAD
ncbi:ATP-binding protein [Kitasatospora sp. GAS204B]|uniref:ATP-binding protein n=1 Tax=unclassified Kitasatospora TaxID=2633591 RepID=UPI002476DE63|nr:ATP-binding protein [Kitasatospora sp. GAS204B]MDH6118042.1 anti-sigma regulatory factor (Ser/Thr protein kinase) [Kitasatospora sp. GAS204B]